MNKKIAAYRLAMLALYCGENRMSVDIDLDKETTNPVLLKVL